MSTTVITKKELHVPTGAIIDVADVLIENEIINEIIGTDTDEDTIIFEIQYGKEQREVIHEVEDMISDFLEEADQDDEAEEDK
ncbi:MAG TPA: hypothetical protein VF487_20795 [Chitinophagaceae bacterium]